jgi:hypothetical protein
MVSEGLKENNENGSQISNDFLPDFLYFYSAVFWVGIQRKDGAGMS